MTEVPAKEGGRMKKRERQLTLKEETARVPARKRASKRAAKIEKRAEKENAARARGTAEEQKEDVGARAGSCSPSAPQMSAAKALDKKRGDGSGKWESLSAALLEEYNLRFAEIFSGPPMARGDWERRSASIQASFERDHLKWTEEQQGRLAAREGQQRQRLRVAASLLGLQRLHSGPLGELKDALAKDDRRAAAKIARRTSGARVSLLENLADYLEALDGDGRQLFLPKAQWAEYYHGNPDSHEDGQPNFPMACVSLTKRMALRLHAALDKDGRKEGEAKDHKNDLLPRAMQALNSQYIVLYICEETVGAPTSIRKLAEIIKGLLAGFPRA